MSGGFELAYSLQLLMSIFVTERAQIKLELEDQYKSILDKNAQEMEDMKKTFEERLKEAEQKGVSFLCINKISKLTWQKWML